MKKNLGYLSILAAGVLVLAGCGGTTDDSSEATDDTTTTSVTTVTNDGGDQDTSDTDSTDGGTDGDTGGDTETPEGAHTNVNMFVAEDGVIASGDATAAGNLCYWAGDGALMSSAVYSASNNSISLTYTGGWAFWSVQLFYTAPYYDVEGTEWTIKASVTSTASGTITINSSTFDVSSTASDIEVAGGAVGGKTLSLQLGVSGDENGNPLDSGTFTLTDLQIIDTVNSYYLVNFKDADGNTLDEVYTMVGQTPWTSPTAPTIEGQAFVGWADENGDIVDLTTWTPTADTTLTATYGTADATVSYYVGTTLIETVNAVTGATITAPDYGYDEYGFGYGLEGWYTDPDFTNAWDFSTAITGTMTLYAKTWVQHSSTYMQDGDGIPDTYFTHDDDGSLVFSGLGGGWSESWHVQINFIPVPVGVSGTNYDLTITYKANDTYPVQIYDNANSTSIVSGSLVANTSEWQTLTLNFNGQTFDSADTKLTFEFGGYQTSGTYELTIGSIAVTAR